MNADLCEFCTPDASEAEQLRALGISRIPAAAYLVGGYRYTNLADAVAQARRLACLAN